MFAYGFCSAALALPEVDAAVLDDPAVWVREGRFLDAPAESLLWAGVQVGAGEPEGDAGVIGGQFAHLLV